MNKKILITVAALLIITLSGTCFASEAINRQLIKSEYGALGDLFGVGDRLYQITYTDNTIEYQLLRTSFLTPATITSSIPSSVSINVGQSQSWKYKITGCCSGLDGQSQHQHKMILYDVTGDTTAMNSGDIFTVADGSTLDVTSGIKTFNTAGTFNFKIKEFIQLCTASTGCVWASGSSIYLTVQVGSQTTPFPTQTTPTPTQTTPTPTSSGNCADGTSNLACSSQKPLYCYYGTLINKASTCGCPSGQSPSGDNCVAVTSAPTSTENPCLPGYQYSESTDECIPIQTTPGLDSTLVIIAIIGIVAISYIIFRSRK